MGDLVPTINVENTILVTTTRRTFKDDTILITTITYKTTTPDKKENTSWKMTWYLHMQIINFPKNDKIK